MTTTTTLLAAGTTDAESADVVVEDGASVTLSVVGQGPEYGRTPIFIRKKNSATYSPKGAPSERLDNYSMSAGQINGPVTFKVWRPAGTASVGVELERS